MAEGLRVIGICLYDEKGEMRNFKDVVNDLAQKWDSIDCNSYTGADTGNENGSTKFLMLLDMMVDTHKDMQTLLVLELKLTY